MGSAVIQQHVRTAQDPFLLGDTTAEMMTLGCDMAQGMHFPVRDGLFVLLRRALYPTPGAWQICGLAKLSDTTIANREGYMHGPDTAWQYTACQVFGNGQMSPVSRWVRMDFDATGEIITPALPAWPIELTAEPIEAGKFTVAWAYDPWGQGDWPSDFTIYDGADVDSIDYGTAIGTVSAGGTSGTYEFTTGAYANGTKQAFAVRARNSGGVEEKNEITSDLEVARSAAPVDAKIQAVVMRRLGGGGAR